MTILSFSCDATRFAREDYWVRDSFGVSGDRVSNMPRPSLLSISGIGPGEIRCYDL